MAKNPSEYYIQGQDLTFFYDTFFRQRGLSIVKRKNISKIARKYNIYIKWDSNSCRSCASKPNEIRIFEKTKSQNKSFFQHMRNAFAHCYIKINNGRCKLLDWNPYYKKKTTKSPFCRSAITMLGDVVLDDFKKILDEFFASGKN